ncbi:MAG: FAD:protein FMN transferase [Minisyncoccia bacterium]
MKETRIIMGMPVIIEIPDDSVVKEIFNLIFDYFSYIDEKFSLYKETSEITKINKGEIKEDEYSEDMKEVLKLSEETKKETGGFFDIMNNGLCDPSGIVKGWAIHNASEILRRNKIKNFYVEAGGDIEVEGKNNDGKLWAIGIANPFDLKQVVKVVYLENKGIATSGTYIRGQHIYNPKKFAEVVAEVGLPQDIVSLTVIGPNAYEADRFATAAFAMGREGIIFIENLPGFEGYMIDKDGIAIMTNGFEKYLIQKNA